LKDKQKPTTDHGGGLPYSEEEKFRREGRSHLKKSLESKDVEIEKRFFLERRRGSSNLGKENFSEDMGRGSKVSKRSRKIELKGKGDNSIKKRLKKGLSKVGGTTGISSEKKEGRVLNWEKHNQQG